MSKKKSPGTIIAFVILVIIIIILFIRGCDIPLASILPGGGSNTPSPNAPGVTCTDSDGKNQYTAGYVYVEEAFYDTCAGNWAVSEQYCENGAAKSQVMNCIAGYICTNTNAGSYCKPSSTSPEPTPTCTDTDGGNVWDVVGTCTDSMGSHVDACSGPTQALDYYCNNAGTCVYAVMNCQNYGQSCVGGLCQSLPCTSPIIPNTASDCTARSCNNGFGCYYSPPSVGIPARCMCGV